MKSWRIELCLNHVLNLSGKYVKWHGKVNIIEMLYQVVTGFMLETLLLGFIFVKVARPKYRAQTILFSKQAVVCIENGILCLQVNNTRDLRS